MNQSWIKKIHLSFGFFEGEMPPKYRKAIKKLKLQNPDISVKIWGPNESRDLFIRRYPWALQKYDDFKWAIQRSDMSRPAILHAEGGVYMDLDYKLKKPLIKIFDYLSSNYPSGQVFINETPNSIGRRSLSNSLMISKTQGHPFWKHFLYRITKTKGNGKGLTRYTKILTSTGPEAITRAYRSFQSKNQLGVIPLPWRVFNPCSVCDRGTSCSKRPEVLAYHKNDSGWHNATAKVYNHFYCNRVWYYVLVPLLIVIVVVIVVVTLRLKRCKKSCYGFLK